jgi:PAS domain S-box-containing protein
VSRETPGKAVYLDTNALFEKLFVFSPDAVLVTVATGNIVRANAQAERMFAFNRRDQIGQPVEILVPERFRSTHPSIAATTPRRWR